MSIFHKLCKWCFDRKALSYWLILAYDCAAVLLSGILVFWIQRGSPFIHHNFPNILAGLFVCLVIYIIAFFAFHTFNGMLRFSSFIDLHRLGYSTFTAGIGTCILRLIQVHFGLSEYICFPTFTSNLLIFICATMLMWTPRILVKSLHDYYTEDIRRLDNTFIYGCHNGAVAIAKSIRSETAPRFRLRGFIAPEKIQPGSYLLGLKIYDDDDSLMDIMKQQDVKVLLVSPILTDRFTHRTTLIDALIAAGIKIMMMPQAQVWDGKSNFSHHQLRTVDIEDLLPRDKIEVNMEAIGKMITGRRVLITGAAGSIGAEIAHQVASFGPADLVLVDQAETPMHDMRLYMNNKYSNIHVHTIVGSITNETHMEEVFAAHKPEFVFHAAAYKHVPMMEDNPAMAVQNNIYGTRVIADLAVKYGTKKFVMISTDKAVNPTNVMGCSKRICEIYCQSLSNAIASGEVKGETQFVTTRFGNVLGSNGSVIPLFKEQIRNGGPVTVTHKDIIRYFMLIPEACRLVLEAGTMGRGGRNIRLRHGRASAHSRPCQAHDRPLRREGREDRIHRIARRREALRRDAQ